MRGKYVAALIAVGVGAAGGVGWVLLGGASQPADAPGGGVRPDRGVEDSASFWTDERVRDATPPDMVRPR